MEPGPSVRGREPEKEEKNVKQAPAVAPDKVEV